MLDKDFVFCLRVRVMRALKGVSSPEVSAASLTLEASLSSSSEELDEEAESCRANE